MRTRQEIKEHAKQMLGQQRWSCVGAVFLVMLIYSVYYVSNFTVNVFSSTSAFFLQTNILVIGAFTGMIFSFISLAAVVLYSVLAVNLSCTMVKAYYGQPIKSAEPYSALNMNFGRKLGGILWVSLWILLWTLIPFAGIVFFFVKSAEYFMAQYILACNPNVKAIDALNLSKRMTEGYKWKIFVMGLSFIGWRVLSWLTIGILGVFYVNPYMYMSLAGMFVEVRNEAIATGRVHPAELDGVAAYYPQHDYSQQQYPSYQQPYGQTTPQYPQQQEYIQQQQYPSYQQQPYGQTPSQHPQQQQYPQHPPQQIEQYGYAQHPAQYQQQQTQQNEPLQPQYQIPQQPEYIELRQNSPEPPQN
ncbi:MAG: DUF975 family protein [Oscillospiraceae bacterium]|nr:DUF975 family protein [Oscillospiraceae bacterium]